MTVLATSPDGQWIAMRRDRELVLLDATSGALLGQAALDGDDIDVALVGGPPMLVVATRLDPKTRVVMYQPPNLDAAAKLEIERPTKIAAISGQRMALVSADGKHALIARAAGKALATQPIDLGAPVEFAVGLEKNQILFSLPKKLEVWDAVSGRPMLKMQLQLPPPPRTVGNAAGHLWVSRPDSDEIFVYRLSDGRPFRHFCGAKVESIVSHPASPVLVVATARGLVRLHCFAHTLTAIEGTPYEGKPMPMAQLVAGEEITLLGVVEGWAEPWRAPLTGPGVMEATGGSAASAESGPRASGLGPRPAGKADEPQRIAAQSARAQAGTSPRPRWRDALAAYGAEVVRAAEAEVPVVAAESELGDLAQRLGLSAHARRTLIALYATHLVGEPALSIARLVKIAGEWVEPLGQGELAAFAMLRRDGGKVALATAVTDVLDGAPPRTIRILGGAGGTPRGGAFRVSRDGRTDAELETQLAAQLGRIGVVEGDLPTALLESRLHGATAVMLSAPAEKPRPWPLEAGLVLVLPGAPSSWLADLPSLESLKSEV
jgi:hypothetical protein